MVLVPKTILFKRPELPEATVLDILTDADEANQFVKEYLMANLRDKFDQFLFDRGRLYGFVVHSEVASPAQLEHFSKLEARMKKDKQGSHSWRDDDSDSDPTPSSSRSQTSTQAGGSKPLYDPNDITCSDLFENFETRQKEMLAMLSGLKRDHKRNIIVDAYSHSHIQKRNIG